MKSPKFIAYYLPQYHPIPENDKWWGKGFTEWTNVAKAKKFFPGHYQPHIPADLGFYDLRLPEVREEQVKLAKEAGIDGFCYWHYWFSKDKELLERPFKEVVESGKPDFPFCLAWANESWQKKLWNKDSSGNETLIEQTYGGVDDYTAHFYSVLPAFKDKRYIQINDKPLFVIYKPLESPEIKVFMNVWNELSIKEGLNGIFWVAHSTIINDKVDYIKNGFDAVNRVNINSIWIHNSIFKRTITFLLRFIFKNPYHVSFNYSMKKILKDTFQQLTNENVCPSIITGWDHTPRSGYKGIVITKYNPEIFFQYLNKLFSKIQKKKTNNYNNLFFIKSWNEWGEGNYLEPDLKYGKGFIEMLKKAIQTNYPTN